MRQLSARFRETDERLQRLREQPRLLLPLLLLQLLLVHEQARGRALCFNFYALGKVRNSLKVPGLISEVFFIDDGFFSASMPPSLFARVYCIVKRGFAMRLFYSSSFVFKVTKKYGKARR